MKTFNNMIVLRRVCQDVWDDHTRQTPNIENEITFDEFVDEVRFECELEQERGNTHPPKVNVNSNNLDGINCFVKCYG